MQGIVNNKNFLGIIFILLYCIIGSLSFVVVSSNEQTFSPVKLLFYNFLFTTLFFNLFSISKLTSLYNLVRSHLRVIFYLNIATAFAWMTTFYALKYLQPAIVIAIIFGLIPVFTQVVTIKQHGLKSLKKSDLTFACLTASVVIAIIGYTTLTSWKEPHHLQLPIYASILFAIISAIATVICIIYMKQLSANEFTTTQVMAVRFYVITILSGLLMLSTHTSFHLMLNDVGKIIMIAGLTLIIPLFLFQKGVENTSAVTASFIIPLQPIMTYAFQLNQITQQVSPILLSLISILSASIVISALYKSKAAYHGKD